MYLFWGILKTLRIWGQTSPTVHLFITPRASVFRETRGSLAIAAETETQWASSGEILVSGAGIGLGNRGSGRPGPKSVRNKQHPSSIFRQSHASQSHVPSLPKEPCLQSRTRGKSYQLRLLARMLGEVAQCFKVLNVKPNSRVADGQPLADKQKKQSMAKGLQTCQTPMPTDLHSLALDVSPVLCGR